MGQKGQCTQFEANEKRKFKGITNPLPIIWLMEKPPDPIENVKSTICPAKFSWLIRNQSPFRLNYLVTRAF